MLWECVMCVLCPYVCQLVLACARCNQLYLSDRFALVTNTLNLTVNSEMNGPVTLYKVLTHISVAVYDSAQAKVCVRESVWCKCVCFSDVMVKTSLWCTFGSEISLHLISISPFLSSLSFSSLPPHPSERWDHWVIALIHRSDSLYRAAAITLFLRVQKLWCCTVGFIAKYLTDVKWIYET